MNATQASSTAWFEWGTDTNYANVTAVRTVPQSYFNVGVVVPISNLTFNTTYHYRLVVTNAAGNFLGNDLSFASNHLIGLSTYPVIGATGPTSARSLAKYRQWF